MAARSSLELDRVLDEVGHFGRYQKQLYCAILVPIVFSAIYNAQYVFTAADPDYRCLVPECESQSSAQWETGVWGSWALVEGSRCERRAPKTPGGACDEAAFTTDTLSCDQWVYKSRNTIVPEFELACHDWKRAMVGTVHSSGVFTALLYIGWLSDWLGRRTAFVLAASLCAGVGVARSFVNSYLLYLALEFLDATVNAGVYTTGFVLVMEMVSIEKRVLCGGLIASVFALGQVLLAVAAWRVPYWRTLTRLLYAPSFLFLLYFLFMEESVRWLFAKNKLQKGIKVLRKIAAVNDRQLPERTVKKLSEEPPARGKDEVAPRSVLCQVLRSRILMTRFAVCGYCWVTSAFVYYGLSINSVSLDGNMYLNYGLVSLVEIPGYMLGVALLNWIGRRRAMSLAYFVCAIALLILPFVHRGAGAEASWAQLILALVGKLFVSTSFNGMYVLTSELFPTAARHRTLAACSLVARLGQINAMLTPLLLSVWASLPFILFGAMAAVAALLVWCLLPETLHAPLPDTVAQAERLSRAHRPRPTAPAAPTPAPAAAPASGSGAGHAPAASPASGSSGVDHT